MKKQNKQINKKGQIGEAFQDVVGAVIIVVLLIIFAVLSGIFWAGAKSEIQKSSEELLIHNQEHLSLQSWLQKPIKINYNNEEQNLTIAELIRLSKINSTYKTLLEQEAAAFNIYNYKFDILKPEDLIKLGYKPIFAGPSIIFVPYLKYRGSLFYIPSNETIIANLEIKKVKW
ncbi:MAG: hypothetical protein N3G19_00380 [Candidatus Pacearchaeota archaeon]|nr:hypothetical protein [Candidatus Pacearchaeota archaeon]